MWLKLVYCEFVAENNSDNSINEAKKALLNTAINLVNSLSQSVSISWDFCFLEDCSNLLLVKETESFIKLFEDFNKTVCDCLVIDAFNIETGSKMDGIITELLVKICYIQSDSLEQLLLEPANQIDHYLTCLKVYIPIEFDELTFFGTGFDFFFKPPRPMATFTSINKLFRVSK